MDGWLAGWLNDWPNDGLTVALCKKRQIAVMYYHLTCHDVRTIQNDKLTATPRQIPFKGMRVSDTADYFPGRADQHR